MQEKKIKQQATKKIEKMVRVQQNFEQAQGSYGWLSMKRNTQNH